MVVVSVTAARHGFDDGDLLALDDFCDGLEGLNTVQGVQCKRLYYKVCILINIAVLKKTTTIVDLFLLLCAQILVCTLLCFFSFLN
jgi:hypothetical protein